MRFTFTGLLLNEDQGYSALCPELDVATVGATLHEARAMLLEAASLHLEGAIEDGQPYLRPIPPDQDPRLVRPATLAEEFSFHLDVAVRASA